MLLFRLVVVSYQSQTNLHVEIAMLLNKEKKDQQKKAAVFASCDYLGRHRRVTVAHVTTSVLFVSSGGLTSE